MRKFLVLGVGIAILAGCNDVGVIGTAAMEKRRNMNDMQARATLAATCDIAVGAYFRALNEVEQRLTAIVCGGEKAAVILGPAALSSSGADNSRIEVIR
ncbi:MAG: hypothetical protein R3D03_07190 [Geminicoccaceae bacterium]|nr:hypothetical protein [Geminicoccaceae bacterium]